MYKKKNILVVDDEKSIRCLLRDVLSTQGYGIRLARDGEDAVRQLMQRRFDLVITDIIMPRYDGVELLKQMKKFNRKEKVIVISGLPFVPEHHEGEIPPIWMRLNKPFRLKQLLHVVAAALISDAEEFQTTHIHNTGSLRAVNAI